MAKWLIGCECSGRIREALRAKGHDVISVDLEPAEDNSPHHVQGDLLEFLKDDAAKFDVAVFNPPCTYLANSGARWLYAEPKHSNPKYEHGRLIPDTARWDAMEAGAQFFAKLLAAPIPKIAVENPVMHRYARECIEQELLTRHKWPTPFSLRQMTHFVQPWWFGDPAFKATGFTLKGLKPLVEDSNHSLRDHVPKPGTPEHKKWSGIHNAPPGKHRWKFRSRTFIGIAEAVAKQWG